MIHQQTFEEMQQARARARRTDPHTSHQAARAARSLASEHQAAILAVLRRGGSWTADEIAERCGLTKVQICRRLCELEREDRIRPTGETRPTPAGRPARCFEIVGGAHG